jgi:hypothetical protein
VRPGQRPGGGTSNYTYSGSNNGTNY